MEAENSHAAACASKVTTDTLGLQVTLTDSPNADEALAHFNTATDYFVNYSQVPLPSLDKALEVDGDFFMAQYLKCAFFSGGRNNLDRQDSKLTACLKSLYSQLSSDRLTTREYQLGKALQAWNNGDLDLGMTLYEDHVRCFPTDMIALRTLHALYLVLGQPRRMRDSLMGVAYAWKESMTYYPLFLSMYAFGLEECNQWEFAREKASKALRMRPDAVWAIHTMAHCHEERSPASHGISFLEGCQEHWQETILGGHIAWHLALNHLDENNVDRVYELFDAELTKRMKTGVVYALVDAASLLWRMECCGFQVGAERWQVVNQFFESTVGQHQSPWFDMHLMFALTHHSDPEQTSKLLLARKLMESMETFSTSEPGVNAAMTKRLGVPVCQALLSYATGDYEQACGTLLHVQPHTLEFGWSTAQRQVFLLQLYHVAKKASDNNVANSALSTLQEMKPYSTIIQHLPFL